jgi:AcrR family transcriptional regulator
MSSTSRRPSLRDEQKALTRRRLIDAAETVFARHGYHGASVEQLAREAGATTGALYANFAGKEDLFLALFEERIETDIDDYEGIVAAESTMAEQARGAGDHWMRILRERPDYFPLLIEFWSYALREPRLRERLAERFATLRAGSAKVAAAAGESWGIETDAATQERLGLFITALANGLALEKLIDPDAVPDELFGEMLALVFQAFEALLSADPDAASEAADG